MGVKSGLLDRVTSLLEKRDNAVLFELPDGGSQGRRISGRFGPSDCRVREKAGTRERRLQSSTRRNGVRSSRFARPRPARCGVAQHFDQLPDLLRVALLTSWVKTLEFGARSICSPPAMASASARS